MEKSRWFPCLRWPSPALNIFTMSIIGTVLEDVTTDVLGKIGAWQRLVTFFATASLIPCFFHTNEDFFLLRPSNSITCAPQEDLKVLNITLCTILIERNATQETLNCDKWYISFMWLFWQKKSWMIFCDDRIKIFSNSIICRLGNVFGSIMIGLFADNFGRKRGAILIVCAEASLSLMAMLCHSRSWFQLLVFLRALFEGATVYMGIVLTCEIASNDWRARLVTITVMPRILAVIFMVPLANAMPNLDTYYCVGFIISCGLLVILRWIPESPQWLLFNRKINNAEIILVDAAAKNKLKLCGHFSIRPVNQRAYLDLDETTTCIEVISNRNVRVIVFITHIFWGLLFFQWSSLYVQVYTDYGYMNFVLLKIIGFLILFGMIELLLSIKLKKKYLLLLNIFITGAFSCSKALHGQLNDWIVKLLLSVPMASGILAQILLLDMTPRFFAINIRCTLFGSCHGAANVGVITGYLLFFFEVTNHLTTLILDVIVMFALAAMCLAFPDIDGRELPDVLRDMDYFSELTKPLRWAMMKTDRMSLEEVELRVYSFGSNVVETVERLPARPIANYLMSWLRYLLDLLPSFR